MALTAAQATRVMGANDRVHVAVVGLGGRGRAHMGSYAEIADCEITALCDVDQAARERGVAQVEKATQRKPKTYVDMKEVFADKSVDAVSMPLPNHWHSLATIWACQAGKDVYVEKPASHNIFEGLRMVDAARKYKRIVQIGSQSRSMAHKQKAMRLLQEGVIGKVYMAKGLCYKRRKSIGHKEDAPVPLGVDWDKFLDRADARVQRAAFQVQLALVLGHRQRRYWQPGHPSDGHSALGFGASPVCPPASSPLAASTSMSTTRRRRTRR